MSTVGVISQKLPDSDEKWLYVNLGFRIKVLLSRTLSYEDISTIYLSPTFASETKGLGRAEQFSIARSIELHARRFNIPVNEETIKILLPFIKKIHQARANREFVNSDYKVVIVSHQDKSAFKPDWWSKYFTGIGINEDQITVFQYDGKEDLNSFKQRVLSAVANADPNTLVLFNMHGGPKHAFYSDGEIGEHEFDRLDLPVAFSYKDLGDAFIKFALNNGGSFKGMRAVQDLCFSADLADKVINYIVNSDAYKQGKIKDLPCLVAVVSKGATSVGNVFLEALKANTKEGQKGLKFRDLNKAAEHMAYRRDVASVGILALGPAGLAAQDLTVY